VSKRLFIGALLALIMLGLLASGWWWLMRTASGAEFLLQRAAGMVTVLRWEHLEGDLRDGITLRGLEVEEPGLRGTIERAELSLRVRWMPGPRVDIAWLRIFDGQLQLVQSEPARPRPAAFTLPDLASPIALQLHAVQIHNLTIHTPNREADPLQIDRLDLAARYHRDLELRSLELTMPELDATLSGIWNLSPPFAGHLQLDTAYRVRPDLEQTLEARIVGDLNALGIDLALHGPASAAGRVELKQLLEDPSAEIDLSGRLGDWPDLDLSIDALSLTGSGSPDAWTATVSGQALRQDLPSNRFDLEWTGDRERAELRRGQVAVLDGAINLSGEIDLVGAIRARIALSVDGLDLSPLYPEWPKQARLSGSARLDASRDQFIVEDLQVTAAPTPLQLSGQGRWLSASEVLSLTLDWSELDWPPVLDRSPPLLQSRSGGLRLAGAPDDWQLELEFMLRALDQPEARIQAVAHGTRSDAEIQSLEIDAGAAGAAQASGQVRWDPAASGQLALKVSDFDMGAYAPELPGRLDAELVVEARSVHEVRLDLHHLDGALRGQPVSGQGHVNLAGDAAAGGRLQLALGANRLHLDSDDGRLWDFGLDAGQLTQLVPTAAGRLSAGGHIDLEAREAALQADLDNGSLGDIRLQQARLETALNWLGDQPGGQLQLSLGGLEFKDSEAIDSLDLQLAGDCLDHQLQLDLASRHGTLDLAARGALDTCRLSTRSVWNGAIETLGLEDTSAGHWMLQEPLALSVTRERVSADAACLVESHGLNAHLCLRGLDFGASGRAAIGIQQVPLELLLVPFDLGFTLTSPLSGELEAAWLDGSGLERVAGHLQLDRGQLQPLSEEDNLLSLESIRLDFTPEGEFLQVKLEALVEGDSRLGGQAQIADLQDPGSATIDAQARLDLPDIGVFLRLVPELDQLGGRLSGELDARGALLGPSLSGKLRLDNGLAVHAPLDLRMEDIVLTLEAGEDRASLRKSMRGGEGMLALSGDLALVDEQWQFDARVEGDRFRFSDVHWLRLSASPDIRLSRAADGLLSVDGDIRLDHLRVGMPPGSEQRIDASPDRRVRGEHDEQERDRRPGRQLQGRLRLDLGEDAQTNALGMQASLAGGLELSWERESTEPVARGVIHIPQGAYRAYGQNLRINDGQVIFTGRAVDNPGLDVDAIREIFGDPQVEAAGVRIRGSARDPRISLFTEPPTSQEKAMAYLITGANIDQADSQAAVNVGFYLLPRLFVSYGIGLFEAGNVLSGRYELSRRWGIRVVSGDRDTGVDLSLAIDR